MSYSTGTHVRFKVDNLGLIGRDELVNRGDEGVVIGPSPAPYGAKWIDVEPCKYPGSVCPVSAEMIEDVA